MQFDATKTAPLQVEGGICLPLADYQFQITEMKDVPTKNDPNKGFCEVHLRILSGRYAGQTQIDRINLYGQDETTTRIAYQRLSVYAHVANKLQLNDHKELKGTKGIANIGPDPSNEKYSRVNIIKDMQGNIPVHMQPCAPQDGPMAAVTDAPAQTQQTETASQPAWNNPAQTQQAQPPTQPETPVNQSNNAPWGGAQTPATASAPANDNRPPWAR